MMDIERQYQQLIHYALNGHTKGDRTGTGTRSAFGAVTSHDHRRDGFPLITLKRTNFKAIVAELLWFISGATNIDTLDSKIWDEWADEDGNVGPIYGAQWRAWRMHNKSRNHSDQYKHHFNSARDGRVEGEPFMYNRVDQLAQLIDGLKNNPHGRRHIISAWNVGDLDNMALPPCHYAMQFYAEGDEHLSIMVHQRSADLLLGVPFNLASYSLLLMMVAQCVGRKPAKHIHTFGDYHVYENHIEAAHAVLQRDPMRLPRVELSPGVTDINEFTAGDIVLTGYESHDPIKLPVAV